MPGKVKVRVVAGRNLPVMDRSSDTTDAYVEVKLGSITYKTEVYRKSLNPQWNSEWFRFEVDDQELQDEPLQIRLMDHDTYSANDAIGKVYVDLNPLLLPPPTPPHSQRPNDSSQPGTAVMSGWLPVYDTMHGIRGEVNIVVKVDLFSDFNKFRQSSCGVQFFFTPEIPAGYRCQNIVGFVEELVVNDDPEYQWIDKIRTPRASNEARQTLFSKLSGELQRRIGLKVLELGGNAVIGYRQYFDLEGETGIVVRGLGSAVTLVRLHYESGTTGGTTHSPSPLREITAQRESPLPIETDGSKSDGGVGGCPTGGGTTASTNGGVVTSSPTHSGKLASPARTSGVSINRRSSDSDLSITPKGGSLAGSGGSSGGGVGKGGTLTGVHRPIMTQESFDLLEYPFLTMKTFPPGFILNLGGTVSARSVKLLDRPHTPEEVETRDNWWTQLRMEIRSHARALACNVVLGYEEFTTISDEVCVLNATGTAAVISLHYLDTDSSGGLAGIPRPLRDPMTLSLDRKDFEQQQGQQNQQSGKSSVGKDGQSGSQTCMSRSHPCIEDGFYGDGSSVPSQPLPPSSSSSAPCQQVPMSPPPCAMCHVPYSETSLPFRVKISKCNICRKGKVPDVLFTTLEVPARIPITGIGCLIQARVARPKRDLKGELNAKEISDSLPFLEYELHKQLINKMKIKGMNALFGLRVRVTVGERLIVGVATATAVFLSALQPPPVPRVTSASSGREDERHRAEVQKLLLATIARNKECYGTKHIVPDMLVDEMNGTHGSDTEDSEDDLPEIDLSSGNKDTSVLELDDMEDAEMIGLLVEDCPPVPLVAVTTQVPPGIPRDSIVTNLQMFTRVWRTKVPTTLNHNVFNQYFDKLLQSVYFKVRKLAPCIIGGLQVNVELPEEDELQISLFGMVLGQGSPVSLQTQTVLSSTINQTSHSEIPHKRAKQDDGEMIFKMEELIPSGEDNTKLKVSQQLQQQQQQQQQYHQPLVSKQSVLSITPVPSVPSIPSTASISSSTSSARSSTRSRNDPRYTNCHFSPRERYGVEITPLSYIPGARIECHLGNLNFFFIRESTSIKESGGLSGFMGSFVTEVLALVRAHVAALGGNAMISYFMSECVLLHNPYKNQGQCLINVGGDVVQVQYNAGSSLHDGSAEE
ncbi:C2 domain-containing protein 5 isoform X3 [Panulirus ornatus]|uniref:C2 domain-containing protein 5 isoform X3 n=1 Tax=Panulirus ornatus TaxID=150431 RepID=UPI003A88512E